MNLSALLADQPLLLPVMAAIIGIGLLLALLRRVVHVSRRLLSTIILGTLITGGGASEIFGLTNFFH